MSPRRHLTLLNMMVKQSTGRMVTIALYRYHAIAAIGTKDWINLLLLSLRLSPVIRIR